MDTQLTPFQIEPQYIKAIVPFAAQKDVRGYLNGVLLVFGRQGSLKLIASDGSTLGVVGVPIQVADERLWGTQVVLDSAALADAAKTKSPQLEFTPGEKSWRVGDRFVPVVDGRYPDWQRLIPRYSDLGEPTPAPFDIDLFKPFGMAAKAFGKKPYHLALHQRGAGNGVVIHLPGIQFLGILMPLRGTPVHIEADYMAWVGA